MNVLFNAFREKKYKIKTNRHKNPTAIVCDPVVFDDIFLERERQFEQVHQNIFTPKDDKKKRSLITTVAASGMGKSAFMDRCAQRYIQNQSLNIFPVCFSFNTGSFGSLVFGNAQSALASRLLMSYFLESLNHDMSVEIEEILIEKLSKVKDKLTFAVECILNDLRYEYNIKSPKLLIGCDEVMKCDISVPRRIITALTSLLDHNDDVSLLCTGLTLDPFQEELDSGRTIVHVPIPLLSLEGAETMIKKFSDPVAANRLAFLSGGHPRTIQVMKTVFDENPTIDLRIESNFADFVDIVREHLAAKYELLENDVIELLRPSEAISREYPNSDLKDALSTGRLYATVAKNQKLQVFASPLLLRHFLKTTESEKEVIVYFKELMELFGFKNDTEFRIKNRDNKEKLFEKVCLVTEKLRRTYLAEELKIIDIFLKHLYKSAAFTHGIKSVMVRNSFDGPIEIGHKTFNFPHSSIPDGMDKLQKYVHDSSTGLLFVPRSSSQIGYDFGFISLNNVTKMPVLQLFEPSFTKIKNNYQTNDEYLEVVKRELVEKVKRKIEGARSLPWEKLGLSMDDIVQIFIFYTDTSHIDWKEELASQLEIDDTRIIILNKKSMDVYFGPMIKLLFAGSLPRDDETDPSN